MQGGVVVIDEANYVDVDCFYIRLFVCISFIQQIEAFFGNKLRERIFYLVYAKTKTFFQMS